MYRSYLSGAVDALERELEYYKQVSREQKEIIEQLHRGYPLPDKPVYIHPYDFMSLIQNVDLSVYIPHNKSIIVINGVFYKQSPHMPQVNKELK